jgi:hypothetical protein
VRKLGKLCVDVFENFDVSLNVSLFGHSKCLARKQHFCPNYIIVNIFLEPYVLYFSPTQFVRGLSGHRRYFRSGH